MGMIKRASLVLMVVFGLVLFVGCNDNNTKKILEALGVKPPIDVEMTEYIELDPLMGLPIYFYRISIISNVDNIVIVIAKINRWNCERMKIGKKLVFGNSYEFSFLVNSCRHVKEVSVKTDKGTWDFTF
ncbi:hypothetical protein CV727_05260 [Helicobacter pylori]|nr:hypothetical protein [Helicobacter pylori]QDY59433.1 hypothetical protein CV727_05260 [Helicobacter pylori]